MRGKSSYWTPKGGRHVAETTLQGAEAQSAQADLQGEGSGEALVSSSADPSRKNEGRASLPFQGKAEKEGKWI